MESNLITKTSLASSNRSKEVLLLRVLKNLIEISSKSETFSIHSLFYGITYFHDWWCFEEFYFLLCNKTVWNFIKILDFNYVIRFNQVILRVYFYVIRVHILLHVQLVDKRFAFFYEFSNK